MPGGRRWHYMIDEEALCGRWIDLRRRMSDHTLHPLRETQEIPARERCQTCVRRLAEREAAK